MPYLSYFEQISNTFMCVCVHFQDVKLNYDINHSKFKKCFLKFKILLFKPYSGPKFKIISPP